MQKILSFFPTTLELRDAHFMIASTFDSVYFFFEMGIPN